MTPFIVAALKALGITLKKTLETDQVGEMTKKVMFSVMMTLIEYVSASLPIEVFEKKGNYIHPVEDPSMEGSVEVMMSYFESNGDVYWNFLFESGDYVWYPRVVGNTVIHYVKKGFRPFAIKLSHNFRSEVSEDGECILINANGRRI